MDIIQCAKKRCEEIGIKDEIAVNYFIMGYTQAAVDVKLDEWDDVIKQLNPKKKNIPHETR